MENNELKKLVLKKLFDDTIELEDFNLDNI